jgi:hypothetical protein
MTGKRVEMHYALALDVLDPYALADDVLSPLEVVNAVGGGTRGATGSALSVTGAELSALRRDAGVLELRVFNPHPNPTIVTIEGRSGWLVDLRGYPESPFEGSFELRPFGIATARLHGA